MSLYTCIIHCIHNTCDMYTSGCVHVFMVRTHENINPEENQIALTGLKWKVNDAVCPGRTSCSPGRTRNVSDVSANMDDQYIPGTCVSTCIIL